MWQATGIASITGKADFVSLLNIPADRDQYTVERQVRIKGDGTVVMLNGDEVGLVAVAVNCAILGMLNNACPSSADYCADRHLDMVTVQPESRVPETGAICLVYPVGLPDGIGQYELGCLPVAETVAGQGIYGRRCRAGWAAACRQGAGNRQ